MSAPTQPGWYPDPWSSGRRYWDGNGWTGRTEASATATGIVITRRHVVIGIGALVAGLAVLWSLGVFDKQLAQYGLNKNECVTYRLTGATVCGDQAQEAKAAADRARRALASPASTDSTPSETTEPPPADSQAAAIDIGVACQELRGDSDNPKPTPQLTAAQTQRLTTDVDVIVAHAKRPPAGEGPTSIQASASIAVDDLKANCAPSMARRLAPYTGP